MSLRTVEREVAANPIELADELIGVHIDGETITAIWRVCRMDGEKRRRSVVVSAALTQLILARVSFGNLLDNVRDDTHERAIDG